MNKTTGDEEMELVEGDELEVTVEELEIPGEAGRAADYARARRHVGSLFGLRRGGRAGVGATRERLGRLQESERAVAL
eukprot:6181403-Pleurochrysis_carterae.AAC.1